MGRLTMKIPKLTKKEEERLKEEKQKKALKTKTVIIIFLIIAIAYLFFQSYSNEKDTQALQEQLTIYKEEIGDYCKEYYSIESEDSSGRKIIDNVLEIFRPLFDMDNNFFIKLLIFLVVVYIIHVYFVLVNDFIELVLVV